MKHLWTRISLSMALVCLFVSLPSQAALSKVNKPDMHSTFPLIESDDILSKLNSFDNLSTENVTEIKKLFATGATGLYEDQLGTSVAIGGDTVVAGAPQSVCYEGGLCLPGRVYIFTRNQTGQWAEQLLLSPDNVADDFFGQELAISGDTLAVYSSGPVINSRRQQAVYLYQRGLGESGGWGLWRKVIPPNPDTSFEDNLSINGDILVVGASQYYPSYQNGYAHIYARNQGGTDKWGFVKTLGPFVSAVSNFFFVSVTVDQDTIVAANCQDVHTFERNQGGSDAWGQTQKITTPSGAGYCYGNSMSVKGNTLVIGDTWDNSFQGPYGTLAKGAAYVYERDPVSRLWKQVTKLTASDSAPDGWAGFFGNSVTIDEDMIVVGASYVKVGENDRQGAAYLFCRNQDGANKWGEVAKLIASDGAAYDYFGTSVATQGGNVAVGSPLANIGSNSLQGAVYIYIGCKKPLVFIPGAGGSSLVDQANGNHELWPGITTSQLPLSLFTSDGYITTTNIIPAAAIREVSVPLLPDEIIYRSLIDALIDQGGYRLYQPDPQDPNPCKKDQNSDKPSLFLFPYDWRFDNVVTASKLKAFIQCVQSFYPNTKVNILAHSMGGLVARRYILDNPVDNNVNTLITIGTPWLGAPKAPYVLETGNFFDNKYLDYFKHEVIKTIVGSFTGTNQLNPSSAWYELGGAPPFREEGVDLDGNDNAHDLVFTYEQFRAALDNRYGHDKEGVPEFKPGTQSFEFHNYAGQDNWKADDTDIPYHHIYGQQRHDRTIIQTIFFKEDKCINKNGGKECMSKSVAIPAYDVGDGTVPMLSAVRIGAGENYNAQKSAWLYQITNQDDELASHTGMCSNPEVIGLILRILADPYKPGPNGVSTPQKERGTAQDEPLLADPARYLTIDGGDELVVYDNLGNDTAPIPGSNARGSVPGLDLLSIGDRASVAVLPTTQVFTVTFKTVDEPLAIDLRIGTGNSTTELIRYQDITVPVDVQARIVLTPQGMDHLHYDGDGDGVYETVVMPTVGVSGTELLDTEPPRVTISTAISQQGETSIMIAATDDGVGVKSLWYSLDGIHFMAYSGSFSMDTCQGGAVFAFANDQLANRSSLVEKPLPCLSMLYLPAVIR